MDYKKLLDDSYREYKRENNCSKLEFLAEFFDIQTYENIYAEKLASKMLKVCLAITQKKNHELIDREPETFYTMVNMPFIGQKIDWGTSIRGCWWDFEVNINSTVLEYDGRQVLNMKVTRDDFGRFVLVMTEFAGQPMECEQ